MRMPVLGVRLDTVPDLDVTREVHRERRGVAAPAR